MSVLPRTSGAPVYEEEERPELEFSAYGIAVHFVVDPAAERPFPIPRSVEIASFEHDILAYAYRGDPPFQTTVLHKPELATVTANFPPLLEYEAEGRAVRLACAGASGDQPRRRRFRLHAARTDLLRSRLSVLHLVLAPDGNAEDSALNEWDLIKLVKLWEGGEGRLPGPGEVQGWLRFDAPNGEEDLSFAKLAELFAAPDSLRQYGGEHRTYRVGTVQLLAHGLETDAEQLLADVGWLTKSPGEFMREAEDVRWRRVRALGGIVQGLLDHREIDAPELSEVFEGLDLDGDQLLGFHKGTLISLAPSDRVWKRTRDTLGVSPYLLIPHGVILHNEERLKAGVALADQLGQASKRRRLSSRALRDIESIRLEIARIRDRELLPQVFHYPQERGLFERALTSRGLSDLGRELGDYLHDTSIEVEHRENARQNADSFVIGVLLALIAAAQAGRFVPDEAVLAAIAILGVGYFVWRYAT